MKKLMMGAALISMAMIGCTNEELIESNESQLFTLEVGKGVESRTYLMGNQLVWSPGDQIYVTSADGKVNGVLTLISGAHTPNGKFQGTVNGRTDKLKNIVFPAQVEGMSMAKADVNKMVAPMTGTIGGEAGNALTFNCGFVKMNVLGLEDNSIVNINGTGIGGTLKYDVASNSWVPAATGSGNDIEVVGAEDATVFIVPVYTTNTDVNEKTELNISVDGGKPVPIEISVVSEQINNDAPILAVTEDGVKNLTEIINPSDNPNDTPVFEETLNISQFNTELINNNGSFDGKGKVLVELKDSDFGTYNKLINKNGEYVYQYYIGGEKWSTFDKYDELNVQNVTFIFVDDNKNNTITTGELQTFINDVSFENCTFIGTTVSPWVLGFSGDKAKICGESAVFNECNFVNIYNRNAIHQNKAKNFVVNECIFTNCSGGMHINADEPESVEITNNKFVESQEDAVMLSIGLEGGDYKEIEKMTVTGNIAEGMYCIRLWKENVTLNQIYAIKANNKYKEFYHTNSIQIK